MIRKVDLRRFIAGMVLLVATCSFALAAGRLPEKAPGEFFPLKAELLRYDRALIG